MLDVYEGKVAGFQANRKGGKGGNRPFFPRYGIQYKHQ
jgi:hypothetical protein